MELTYRGWDIVELAGSLYGNAYMVGAEVFDTIDEAIVYINSIEGGL